VRRRWDKGETVEIAAEIATDRDWAGALRHAPTGAAARTAPHAGSHLTTVIPNLFVIPAFNEAENLPRLIADLEALPELRSPGSRVVVVDDGSLDDTAAIVTAYDGCLPLELLRLERNMGPGAAFRLGFLHVLADCPDEAMIVTLEADTTSDLAVLPTMLAKASAGADVVLASVHGGGEMLNVSILRRILSRCAGYVVRVALKLDARTVSSFFRVYRASALRAAFARYGDGFIQEPGFACKAEILAKLSSLGVSVNEVPVDLDGSKRIGESNMRIAPTLSGYWRVVRRQRAARRPA
jgi:dolichol-phosphate mannosyltransferase